MKKYYIGGFAIATIVIAGVNVNLNSRSNNNSSSLLKTNVEALTSCESPVLNWNGSTATLKCKNSSGEEYMLSACDFDDAYITMCNGRSVK